MCPFTVRVTCRLAFSGFSRQSDYAHYWIAPGSSPYYRRSAEVADLPASPIPTDFNGDFRHPAALSLLRLHFTLQDSTGILTRSSIGLALRLSLRSRLTLIRLALIRKPWSFGGRVSRPPYRYLYLHLLFQTLQHGSRHIFDASGMLPYRYSHIPRLR